MTTLSESDRVFDRNLLILLEFLVDQVGHRTNSTYINDFIGIFSIPKDVGTDKIADLYVKEGLTAAQVAARVGLSKASILRRLHSLGIRKGTLHEVTKGQPRPAVRAAYGQRIISGKLVNDRQEQKVARLIVELRERQKLGWKEVVDRLNGEGLRTRSGIPWKVGRVRMVFDRWHGKL